MGLAELASMSKKDRDMAMQMDEAIAASTRERGWKETQFFCPDCWLGCNRRVNLETNGERFMCHLSHQYYGKELADIYEAEIADLQSDLDYTRDHQLAPLRQMLGLG